MKTLGNDIIRNFRSAAYADWATNFTESRNITEVMSSEYYFFIFARSDEGFPSTLKK